MKPINTRPDGGPAEVCVTGLTAIVDMAFAADDAVYLTNCGISPTMGQVLRVDPQ